MRVGIICAGDREVAPFLPMIDNCQIVEKAMLKFYEGQINGVDIVTLFSGVCKVNAAIATQILIDTFGVNIIINAGTAGGMNENLEIFDTVISTEVAYHDVAPNILTEFHPWLETVFFKADQGLINLTKMAVDKLGQEYKVYWGRMVTGETFIADEGRQAINEQFSPLTVDMETASVAHVCYVNNIPFISIRSVTDTATHSGAGHFEENCERASIIARDITVALLKELSMAMLKLVKATDLPASKVMQFRQDFLSAREHSINGSRGLHNYDNYDDWLWLVRECEKPDNTLLGVQASTYFAVRMSDETVVGCIELRHTLNETLSVIGGHIGYSVAPEERKKGYATEMLKLVLTEAKKAGLAKVLLTCDVDNIASCKTIEKCGGKREKEDPFELDDTQYYKYWINC